MASGWVATGDPPRRAVTDLLPPLPAFHTPFELRSCTRGPGGRLIKIIIPTKGRADVIGGKALRLFLDATLCVGADGVEAYQTHLPARLRHWPENSSASADNPAFRVADFGFRIGQEGRGGSR
jgi:hypothetical protein